MRERSEGLEEASPSVDGNGEGTGHAGDVCYMHPVIRDVQKDLSVCETKGERRDGEEKRREPFLVLHRRC